MGFTIIQRARLIGCALFCCVAAGASAANLAEGLSLIKAYATATDAAASPFVFDTTVIPKYGGATYGSDPVSYAENAWAPALVYHGQNYLQGKSVVLSGLKAGKDYVVEIHAMETYWIAEGKRVGTIAINGTTVCEAYDVFKLAGGKTIALCLQYPAIADENGSITIAFAAASGSPDSNIIAGGIALWGDLGDLVAPTITSAWRSLKWPEKAYVTLDQTGANGTLSLEKCRDGVWSTVCANLYSASEWLDEDVQEGDVYRTKAVSGDKTALSDPFPLQQAKPSTWTYGKFAVNPSNPALTYYAISNTVCGVVVILHATWDPNATPQLTLGSTGTGNNSQGMRFGAKASAPVMLDFRGATIKVGESGEAVPIETVRIGKQAFGWFTSMKPNPLPVVGLYVNGVTVIRDGAFTDNTSMREIDLEGTFWFTPGANQTWRLTAGDTIKHLRFASQNLTHVGRYDFCGNKCEEPFMEVFPGLDNAQYFTGMLTVNDTWDWKRTEWIGNTFKDSSFGGPVRLEKVCMMQDATFFNTRMTDLYLGGSITNTWDSRAQYGGTFARNTSLTNVVIDSPNFNYLGNASFYNCTALKRLEFITPHAILIDGSLGGPYGQLLNQYDVFSSCPLAEVFIHGKMWDSTSLSKLVLWHATNGKGIPLAAENAAKQLTVYVSPLQGWAPDGVTLFAPTETERAAFVAANPGKKPSDLLGVLMRNSSNQSRAWVAKFKSSFDPSGFLLYIY
ncbi:MAG: malectin domain-containing carbohydrate-binding protein [Kiritimatiellia bacterium]|nr:malectin domain-containing carbohydrate-binding protein [Kiritimatiellia bacterium]